MITSAQDLCLCSMEKTKSCRFTMRSDDMRTEFITIYYHSRKTALQICRYF